MFANMIDIANTKKRAKNEIGMTSIRGGNIVGEHTVKFLEIPKLLK